MKSNDSDELSQNILLKKQFQCFIHKCIQEVITCDTDLFETSGNERSIAFRLGHYLQNELKNLKLDTVGNIVVDSEYRKNGINEKFVYGTCRTCTNGQCYIQKYAGRCGLKLAKETRSLENFAKNANKTKTMRPDLLIHTRGITPGNLLAIEIKCYKKTRCINASDVTQSKVLEDFAKLTYLTCQKSEYRYKLGLHILFSSSDKLLQYTWFENGRVSGNNNETFRPQNTKAEISL